MSGGRDQKGEGGGQPADGGDEEAGNGEDRQLSSTKGRGGRGPSPDEGEDGQGEEGQDADPGDGPDGGRASLTRDRELLVVVTLESVQRIDAVPVGRQQHLA